MKTAGCGERAGVAGLGAGELELTGWYVAGPTLEQVVATAGMSRARVVRVLGRHGVARRPKGTPAADRGPLMHWRSGRS